MSILKTIAVMNVVILLLKKLLKKTKTLELYNKYAKI